MTIIATQFDYPGTEAYSRLLTAFKNSIRQNMPHVTLHVTTLPAPDTTDPRHIDFISNTHKLNEWARVLHTIDDEHIIFADCDLLVLKDFSNVFDEQFDIGYTIRHVPVPYMNGGLVFVKNTPEAREFIQLWNTWNTTMYENPKLHQQYLPKYLGINQCAFGYLYEHPELFQATLKPFPCKIYNACNESWNCITAQTKVIHIKGSLRNAVLRNNGYKYAQLVQLWRKYYKMKFT